MFGWKVWICLIAAPLGMRSQETMGGFARDRPRPLTSHDFSNAFITWRPRRPVAPVTRMRGAGSRGVTTCVGMLLTVATGDCFALAVLAWLFPGEEAFAFALGLSGAGVSLAFGLSGTCGATGVSLALSGPGLSPRSCFALRARAASAT